MQTIRYYRDYAERARRLTDSVDRRGIRETLETLAAGFEEIARALETGMVSAAPPQQDQPRCSSCQAETTPAIDGPARFLSSTRH
jgi:dissimilatory sulfite reductase (desulfoviridin) alpha/beta subunit